MVFIPARRVTFNGRSIRKVLIYISSEMTQIFLEYPKFQHLPTPPPPLSPSFSPFSFSIKRQQTQKHQKAHQHTYIHTIYTCSLYFHSSLHFASSTQSCHLITFIYTTSTRAITTIPPPMPIQTPLIPIAGLPNSNHTAKGTAAR